MYAILTFFLITMDFQTQLPTVEQHSYIGKSKLIYMGYSSAVLDNKSLVGIPLTNYLMENIQVYLWNMFTLYPHNS